MNSAGYRKIRIHSTEVMDITPEVANAILQRQADNRKLRTDRVRQYAKAMIDGQWVTSPQGIIVSTSGALLDGQHRLAAVVASGVTIRTLVTRVEPTDGNGKLNVIGLPVDLGLARNDRDVTGESTTSIRVVKSLWRDVLGMQPRGLHSPYFVARLIEPIRDSIESVTSKISKSRKTFSQAAVLSVATLRDVIAIPISQFISDAIHDDIGSLPVVWQKWYTKLISYGRSASLAEDRKFFYTLTWTASEQHADGKDTLILTKANEAKAMRSMKEVLTEVWADIIGKEERA